VKRDGFTVSGSSPPPGRGTPCNAAHQALAPSAAFPAPRDSIPPDPTFPLLDNTEADLFALPLPVPDPTVGRRERRKMRRHAQYDARRKAGLCVACGRLRAAAAHLSRCAPCLEIQIRSASRRKRPSNCQSTAHLTNTDLDTKSATVILTIRLERTTPGGQ
jgi:hypothetical protein